MGGVEIPVKKQLVVNRKSCEILVDALPPAQGLEWEQPEAQMAVEALGRGNLVEKGYGRSRRGRDTAAGRACRMARCGGLAESGRGRRQGRSYGQGGY